jgi:hypothetical protein
MGEERRPPSEFEEAPEVTLARIASARRDQMLLNRLMMNAIRRIVRVRDEIHE